MESDDDYQQTTHPEEPSSPIHQRKLKRLTKATRVLNIPIAQVYSDSIPSLEVDDIPINSDLESSKPVLEDSIGKMEVLEDGSASPNELDELFEYRDRAEDEAMYNVEEEDRLADSAEKNQSNPGDEFGEDKAKSVKKRPSLKEGQVEAKKNNKTNKRSKKSVDDNGNSEASVRTKKKLEKERKTHLQQLHAESQRLLRETRDAAFKPVPLVQKPISSILEKIRQRKLEVSKKVSMLNNHGAKEVMTDLYSEQIGNGNLEDKEHAVVIDLYSEQVGNGNLEDKEHAEDVEKDTHQHEDSNSVDVTIMESCSEPACILSSSKNICSSTALDGESKSAFRAPIDDTQDLFDDSDQSDGEDSQDSQEENLLEEVLAPSVLTMNLKLDSAPIDDVSQENDDSDEENYDKENINPHPDKQIDRDSNPKFDPVKAFVDDEAEEEDDSDNDLMRVKDNEEDEENEDGEEFNDLIVTGYKEKPSDNVKRDQLHQMWLEQQDATATDNVLQRLKCNENQHRAPIALEEVEDEDDGDFSEGSMDVGADDLHPRRVARINSKKMKQMIPQMFTDKDDVYLSSDDEETEQKLVKMRFLEKAEEHTSYSYPAEDENSREVFGLIKKVNIAPDLKKKSKSSSYFDTSITGGNSNSMSKSFLGHASSSSLPSSNKTGSSSFRSFIFSRDDSNSRSAITATEAFSDVGENLNLPTKTTRAKFNNSQSKFNSQTTSQTSSSSSLLEHLRRSTQIDHAVRNSSISETRVAIQFAAFKSAKKSIKTKA